MAPRRQDFDDVDAVWQRPRALYLLGGGWILFVCWFVGSLAGLDKRVVHDRPFLIRGQDVDVHSQQILLKLPAVEAESFQDFPVDVQPSQEVLPMSRDFYTSNFSGSDTSTTIIFNVFKGRPKALAVQLLKALTQKHVAPPEVWVMCFNSPMEKKYKHVVEAVKRKYPALAHKIKFTVSDFNFKFHGRFLLAYMATTKYVLIVDDDKAIDGDTVNDYLKYMKLQKGVWGNNGHRRAATFEGYKSWPKNPNPNLNPFLISDQNMSGIIHKIEEKLHMGGGHKEGDKEGHHGEHKKEEHKKEEHGHGHSGDQHKEGLVDKIKDKIHGDESGEKHHHKDGEGKKEKKKKKDKKEKKHDGHDSSSSSDSD